VTTMRTIQVVVGLCLTVAATGSAAAQGAYPAVDGYLMPREAEIAMARSAAPAALSAKATVKVLTRTGFEVASQGDNGMVCLVMRGFSAPTYTPAPLRDLVFDASVRAPICFAAPAAKTVLPYYELRTTLGLAGKTPDQIAVAVADAYKTGKLPKRTATTFAYMFSAHQHLGPVGAWHPHMMVFTPLADKATVGDVTFDGSPVPMVTDDAGTPFSVVVVPVGDALFVHQ